MCQADVERAVQDTVERYGRIDVCFNNAGIEGERASIGESSVANWDAVEETLRGTRYEHFLAE